MDIEMTFEEWVEKCKPKMYGDYILVYETYGKGMDYVNKQEFVYTILNWGEGDWLVSGLHYVNRMGYIMCENECEEEINIEITDEIYKRLLYTI
jgi:hypothetical protein